MYVFTQLFSLDFAQRFLGVSKSLCLRTLLIPYFFPRRCSNLLCRQLRGTRFNQATECQLLFADNWVGSCSAVATTYVLTDSLGTVALSLVCKFLIKLLGGMY